MYPDISRQRRAKGVIAMGYPPPENKNPENLYSRFPATPQALPLSNGGCESARIRAGWRERSEVAPNHPQGGQRRFEELLLAKKIINTDYYQVIFVFIAFLAMAFVSYFYTSGIVRQQVQDIGDVSMDVTQASVSASQRETELIFANMVQQVEGMLSNQKTNGDILDYLRTTNMYFNAERSPLPDFMKAYAHIRDEWLDGSGWVPPEGYVPESRPWHIGAMNNDGKIFFSEPYQDAQTGGMCISFSQKLFDQEGKAYGVLAIDLMLTRIIDQVRQQRILGNGYGIFVDDAMRFVVHRNQELIGKRMEQAGGDYLQLARMLKSNHPISAVQFKDTDNTNSVVFFRTIFNGWRIGVVIPRTSYYSEVYSLAAVLCVLGFFLATALSALLIRYRVDKMRSKEESLSKSAFLARMSHEMRTPMNAIIGMANIAIASNDTARKEYCLARISEASTHLLGVINDVLDISKIEAGKLELSETDFLFASMLRQVETVIACKISEKKQHLRVTVEDAVPRALVADRQRLAQVIANLLSNANKFTHEGGHITLNVRRLADEEGMCVLEFSVADDGIGIAPEQQGKLFHSFEQADGSISRKYGGTGLGLAISKKIIEFMRGRIWLESEKDKGACFFFTIQAREGAASRDASLEEAPQAVQGQVFAGKRLLLAEDVEINREILVTLLEDTGIQIDSAENGQVACDMFAANPEAYDMIFMDLQMPEMDGYEATKRIRSMETPRARTIPIVAMSANVFREDIEKCLACGMDNHLGKPLEIHDVLEKMRKYLL
jgi:signal transduction histidine kinase/ActR/RegA family two-component response regulator